MTSLEGGGVGGGVGLGGDVQIRPGGRINSDVCPILVEIIKRSSCISNSI